MSKCLDLLIMLDTIGLSTLVFLKVFCREEETDHTSSVGHVQLVQNLLVNHKHMAVVFKIKYFSYNHKF
jgi:hypothetical protein